LDLQPLDEGSRQQRAFKSTTGEGKGENTQRSGTLVGTAAGCGSRAG